MVINIRTALNQCADHVSAILRRNNILVEYYIYPEPVPTTIAAYEPRLLVLQDRIRSIKKVNFSHLEQLINDPDCLFAPQLISIIDDLFNVIFSFQHLFEQHYDPNLRQPVPYREALQALGSVHQHLHHLIRIRDSNSTRPRAWQLVAHHNDGSSYQFCRGAIQVLNNYDRGLITTVPENDLFLLNRNTLSSQGGAYLWWICPFSRCPLSPCAFKLRFHVLDSQGSSIHTNSETRTHPSVNLEYRSTLLIKSHLHVPSDGAVMMKYGCLFCFAEGRPLEVEVTAFGTGRALATHLCDAHQGGKLPQAMLLQVFKVAIDGQCPGVNRWDANFLRG